MQLADYLIALADYLIALADYFIALANYHGCCVALVNNFFTAEAAFLPHLIVTLQHRKG